MSGLAPRPWALAGLGLELSSALPTGPGSSMGGASVGLPTAAAPTPTPERTPTPAAGPAAALSRLADCRTASECSRASCAGRPRWRCGCPDNRKGAGRTGPWGRRHSRSTSHFLEMNQGGCLVTMRDLFSHLWGCVLRGRHLPFSVATCDRAWAYVAELRRVPGMQEGKNGPLGPTVLLMLWTADTLRF